MFHVHLEMLILMFLMEGGMLFLKHVKRKCHQDITIKAETRWAIFVAKHNIAFLASDLATNLIRIMFPDDSKIARKLFCG